MAWRRAFSSAPLKSFLLSGPFFSWWVFVFLRNFGLRWARPWPEVAENRRQTTKKAMSSEEHRIDLPDAPNSAADKAHAQRVEEQVDAWFVRGMFLLVVLATAGSLVLRVIVRSPHPAPVPAVPVVQMANRTVLTGAVAGEPLFAWPVVLLAWPGKNAQPPASCVFTCDRSPAPPLPVSRRAEVRAAPAAVRATRVAALDVVSGCLLAPPHDADDDDAGGSRRATPDYETGPWTATLAELGGTWPWPVVRLWVDRIGPVLAANVSDSSALEFLGFGNASQPRLLPLCDAKIATAAQLSADAAEEREALLSAPWRLGPWTGDRLPLFHPDRALAALCAWDPAA